MIHVTLPDGQVKTFDNPVTLLEIATFIGPGLAKAAVAGTINETLVDISSLVSEDSHVSLITKQQPEAIEIIRHSTAHLMAHAVKRCFPEVKVTIGPVIEQGFYYDFATARSFTVEDLAVIEAEMRKIVKEKVPIERCVYSRAEALSLFDKLGEDYKVDIIQSIDDAETLTFYRQGDFIDLCRGPHVPHTGFLKAFKLMKVAGAYWRGSSDNEMLQRIYGTAFADDKTLQAHLQQLAEAEKRDHRKLGKQMGLFHFQEEAPGMVFWHEAGWQLYRTMQDFLRGKLMAHGYREVRTPQMLDRKLWEQSGHWDKFSDEMFITETENRTFAIKPMTCPAHIQIYNQGITSYRELPVRLSEFGNCHRREPSGTLHGLMRVRNFVQDDGHVFCRPDQIQDEVRAFNELLFEVYRDFGFEEVILKLSTRPEKRVGSDEVWDRSEKALADALDAGGYQWELSPGEGAFYGPKIEFSMPDSLGRVWQCGTMQVDFSMPGRLGASYIDADGHKQTPVLLHRAIIGTFERFIGILIEHHAGHFPFWLSPTQAVVMNISDSQLDYAKNLNNLLQNNGFRCTTDLRNEKIGYKIREHTLKRVPYLLVVGDREVENHTVSVRQANGEDMGSFVVDDLLAKFRRENQPKSGDE